MKGVATEFTFGQRHAVHAELPASFALPRDRAIHHHLGLISLCVGQGLQQIEHTAAFGKYGFVRCVMRTNRVVHRRVGLQLLQMQFRVTARQIQLSASGSCVSVSGEKNSSSAPMHAAHRGWRDTKMRSRIARHSNPDVGKLALRRCSIGSRECDGFGQDNACLFSQLGCA